MSDAVDLGFAAVLPAASAPSEAGAETANSRAGSNRSAATFGEPCPWVSRFNPASLSVASSRVHSDNAPMATADANSQGPSHSCR